jgi:GSH-dependent disulfide-bond oxidoreductase
MIRIYYAETPNVLKITIALAEMGLPNEWQRIDIRKGEQFEPGFLAISPNNRVPAIEDLAPNDAGAPISIFESGAILLYLSEKTGKLIPSTARGKAGVTQWIMWQMAGLGPMMGQLAHFQNYAPEKLPYAVDRYANECRRLFKVLDTRLAESEYLTIDYSIADIAVYPWLIVRAALGLDFDNYPHLARWFDTISIRPAVKEALANTTLMGPAKMDDETRKILFQQKG